MKSTRPLVLVVDEDDRHREALGGRLRDDSWDVTLAANPAEALALLEDFLTRPQPDELLVVARSAALDDESIRRLDEHLRQLRRGAGGLEFGQGGDGDQTHGHEDLPPKFYSPGGGHQLKDLERAAIEKTLEECGGHRTRAADALGISVRTLQRKLKAWGINRTESVH